MIATKTIVKNAEILMKIVRRIAQKHPNKDVDEICDDVLEVIEIPEEELDIFWDRLMQETYTSDTSEKRFFY